MHDPRPPPPAAPPPGPLTPACPLPGVGGICPLCALGRHCVPTHTPAMFVFLLPPAPCPGSGRDSRGPAATEPWNPPWPLDPAPAPLRPWSLGLCCLLRSPDPRRSGQAWGLGPRQPRGRSGCCAGDVPDPKIAQFLKITQQAFVRLYALKDISFLLPRTLRQQERSAPVGGGEERAGQWGKAGSWEVQGSACAPGACLGPLWGPGNPTLLGTDGACKAHGFLPFSPGPWGQQLRARVTGEVAHGWRVLKRVPGRCARGRCFHTLVLPDRCV